MLYWFFASAAAWLYWTLLFIEQKLHFLEFLGSVGLLHIILSKKIRLDLSWTASRKKSHRLLCLLPMSLSVLVSLWPSAINYVTLSQWQGRGWLEQYQPWLDGHCTPVLHLEVVLYEEGNNTVYYVRSATSEPLSCICALLFFNKAGARSVCPVPQMKHGLLWRQRIRNEAEKKRTKQGHGRWVSCRGIFLGSITAAGTRLCLFWREATRTTTHLSWKCS